MKKIILGFVFAAAPLGVFAADDLQGLITLLIKLINSVIPLLFGFALLGFMWGVVRYIASANVEKIKEARKFIVFSVVAIAVMLSIWTLALFLKNSIFPGGAVPYNPNGSQPQGVDFYNSGTSPTPPSDIMNPTDICRAPAKLISAELRQS